MSETKRYLWWNDGLDLPQMNPKYLTESNLWDSTWLKEENSKLWAERLEEHKRRKLTTRLSARRRLPGV